MPFDAVLGQRIAPFGNLKREIIGVVGDVTLDAYGTNALIVYHAHRQFAGNRNWALTQVVATDASTGADPSPPCAPMVAAHGSGAGGVSSGADGRGRRPRSQPRAIRARPDGRLRGVSLLLAALGLYGVLAYTVRQRTQEIGIRMALGATAAQVRALVLRQAALVLAIGLVAGTAGALLLGRWLSSLVFQTSPSDPRILLATALVLTVTGLIAAWLPARRASRVEPRIAMQEGD